MQHTQNQGCGCAPSARHAVNEILVVWQLSVVTLIVVSSDGPANPSPLFPLITVFRALNHQKASSRQKKKNKKKRIKKEKIMENRN
jgi:hypothetical protein